MSANKQSTHNGAETGAQPARQHAENLHDHAQVLWEVGADNDFDSVEAEMREAARRWRERGLIEGGDDR